MDLAVHSVHFKLAKHNEKSSEQVRHLALDATRGSRTRRVAQLELHRLPSRS